MKDTVMGIIRHILTSVGGAVVATGYVGQDDYTAIVGGVVALIGVVWSVLDKKKTA